MFSNGNSFANGNSHNTGNSMLWGERRNTEPFWIRLWSAIQQGAV